MMGDIFHRRQKLLAYVEDGMDFALLKGSFRNRDGTCYLSHRVLCLTFECCSAFGFNRTTMIGTLPGGKS